MRKLLHMCMLLAGIMIWLTPQALAAELTNTWYWQAEPSDTSGMSEEMLIQETLVGRGEWQPFDYPAQPPFDRESHRIWLMTTLPSEAMRDATLRMNITNQSFEVWLENEKIYSYGDLQPRIMSYGQRWHLIFLPSDYAGKKLFIHAYSSSPLCLGNFAQINLDSSVVQMATILRQDIPYIANIPMAIFMILIMFLYYNSPTAPKSLYTQIILFMIVFVLWMICASNTKQLLLDAPVFWWGLLRLTIYLLPVLANLIIYRVVDKKYRSATLRVMLVFIVLMFVALLGELFGLGGLDGCTSAFYIMLPTIEGLVVYWSVRSTWRGNRYCRALLIPMCSMVLAGTLDGFSLHFHWLPEYGFFLPYGTITIGVFVLYVVQQQIRRERMLALRAAGLEEAARKAEIDDLTNCYNRKRMDAVLDREIYLHGEEKDSFSLIMLDLDFFKIINDTYGHDAGDRVLAGFADLVRDNIKKSDVFVRWGGEEFILVCCGCTGDEAQLVAERLRRQVEASDILPMQKITCSVGVSSWGGKNDNAEQLLKRVDGALYNAKRSGRNMVCRDRGDVI